MEKVQSLADFLGTSQPDADEREPDLVDISGSPEKFCKAVLNSREFRRYIVNTLTIGNIPPAVLMRIMDTAGWPSAKRLEVTGKDGEPIETITRIVRTIVDPQAKEESEDAPSVIH